MGTIKGMGRIAGGLWLVSLAACGGRTGEFDAYDSNTSSSLPANDGAGVDGKGAAAGATSIGVGSSAGGSTVTGTGSAGSSSTQGGASGIAGSAGSSSAGDGTGGAAGELTTCNELCNNSQFSCPDQLGQTSDCLNDCASVLEQQNGACESLASGMLLCIAHVLAQYGNACDQGLTRAETQCGKQAALFESCSSNVSPPSNACFATGSASAAQCSENITCPNGQNYSVTCYAVSPDRSACTCTGPAVSALTLSESTQYACDDAATACRDRVSPK